MQYSKEFQITFMLAMKTAQQYRHEYTLLEHIFFALLQDPEAKEVLEACGADLEEMRQQLLEFFTTEVERLLGKSEVIPEESLALQRVIQRAATQAVSSERDLVTSLDILVALFAEEESHVVHFLAKQDVSLYDVKTYIAHGDAEADLADPDADSDEEEDASETRPADKKGDFLSRFTINLTDKAKRGELDAVIGRDEELSRCIQTLCRRRKNNPVLVGEPGVGKTSIVEGLAQRISSGQVPDQLKNAQIFALDMGAVVAGTKFRGDFEERLKNIVAHIKKMPGAIIFIDEIHSLVGAGSTSGGTMDASNLLKPALSSGEIRCIGSTTFNEFKIHLLKDRALVRRFHKIDIAEPSQATAIAILKGVKGYYEQFHKVRYVDAALRAAVELSARFITDRCLPDKAIDVLDEAGAAVSVQPLAKRKKIVNRHDIEDVVGKMAQVPSAKITAADREHLLNLEEELRKNVFGQNEAVAAVAKAIKTARAGLRDDLKPIGAFLFVGPTGVGKTELALRLADVMGVNYLRFDMSEYAEKHTVSRLIGAPPGYVGHEQGGQLTDAVNRTPYAVLLLDEVEKAHPDVFNILLQVMDNGFLTDSNGRRADFRNIVLIMTSNIGAREMAGKLIGFENEQNMGAAERAVERFFAPEFRNRLDAIVRFHPLDLEIVARIVDKFIRRLSERLAVRKVSLVLTPQARKYFAEKGFDPTFGARPLGRLIDREIKHVLTDMLLAKSDERAMRVTVDLKEGKIEVREEVEGTAAPAS